MQIDISHLVLLDKRLSRAAACLKILALLLFLLGLLAAVLLAQPGSEAPVAAVVVAFLSAAIPAVILLALAEPLRYAHRWAAILVLVLLAAGILLILFLLTAAME